MTGVAMIPPGVTPQGKVVAAVSPVGSTEVFQRTVAVEPVIDAASNAYTLSFSVAKYTTFFNPTLGIFTWWRYNTCASICPSTLNSASLPKVADVTFAG